jgi:GT2 family glycosyltransferase
MAHPQITIVVSPRERFSYSIPSLESIYQHTTIPFSLIYVDGGSPENIKEELVTLSQSKGFKLIRTEHYLSPNQARNLAIPHANTEYILFIDNDVVVSPQWLELLLDCAKEEDATVVCPLTCIGSPETIHLAGGEARIYEETKEDGTIRRKVHEKHYFVNRNYHEVKDQLKRQQCEFAEFHCMLVRREIFDRIGLLDEGFLSTREHIDFCLSVAQAGGKIYCEPESIVTYVPELPFNLPDLSYFMLRWSDEWELKSLEHFQKKWNLFVKDKYFQKRYQRLGHRRHQAFLKPLLRQLPFEVDTPEWQQIAVDWERLLNKVVTERYSQSDIASQRE